MPLVFAFRPPVSAFSLSAFQLFTSWPVEQRALGLLLAGCDFNQAPKEIGSNSRSALSQLIRVWFLAHPLVIGAARMKIVFNLTRKPQAFARGETLGDCDCTIHSTRSR